MRGASFLRVGVLALLGCAARPEGLPQPSSAASSARVADPNPRQVSATPVVAPVDRVAPAPRTLGGVTIARELEAPIRRLAIDRPPHLAALTARSVWIHDAKGWREELLPTAIAADPALELDVFYGRDYRVRVVGYRGAPAARTPVYLRWLPGGFRAAPDELGKLGAQKTGTLLAILGTADPEIVCRPGDECLVKRLSGWSRASAPPGLTRLAIAEGTGFAIAGKQLLKLDRDWSNAAPAGGWERADALFVLAHGAWVIESERDRIHRSVNDAWQSEASPLPRPRALFGVESAGSALPALWLAADGGLARFDGSAWYTVGELATPLAALAGRANEEVWAAGSQGLFRVRVDAAPKR